MPRKLISELKVQIDLVKAKLRALEDKAYKGAMSPRFLKEDVVQAQKLLDRKKELEQELIDWKE